VAGTLTWRQGSPQGYPYGLWKVLPPPYKTEDMFTMKQAPPGAYKFAVGKGSAFKTLQALGKPPQDAEVDLGWARVKITSKSGKLEIDYTHDVEANVGKREYTIGMGEGQIPLEVADAAKEMGISGGELIERAKKGENVYKLVGMEELKDKSNKEFSIKWVDSWRELPEDGRKSTVTAYTDSHTGIIYAIKGVTSKADIEHEKYHASVIGKYSKPDDEYIKTNLYIREELEANKKSYDTIRKPTHIIGQLRAIFNDVSINLGETPPQEAMQLINEELKRVNPPQEWLDDYKILEKEYHELHQKQRDNPKSIFYGDIEEVGERPDEISEHIEEKIPRRMTAKPEPPRELEKTELAQYRSGRNKVYLVNMDYVEKNPDVIQPKNEIWLDRKLDIIERKENLLQQLSERNRMEGNGEQEYKGNIRELDNLISEQLERQPLHINGNGRKPKEPREVVRMRRGNGKEPVKTGEIAERYYLGRKLTEVDIGVV